MLPGIKIKEIKKFPDERGSFAEIFREDWSDLIESEDKIIQVNLSYSYPGMIRAWHRHHRGQVDYFITVRGATKICAYDDTEKSPTRGNLDEIISSEEKIQCVRIPGYYYHGFKSIGSEPSLVVYLTTKLYDYKNPDEERRLWNDQTIINPRTNKPFDWNALPHK
ncbi:MAG: dTDP-4-dehydrorhamnose 3,5-epimerase [Nitrosarchaeum sp.]|nr:MAG: dTDP-4-dehydrorhamnose 3,5-epimerase [Nitrosarchaeum sp.]